MTTPSAYPRAALTAGLGGGVAEVVWIAAYCSLTLASGADVAREITLSVLRQGSDWIAAPIVGIAIHMALSVALGFVLAGILERRGSRSAVRNLIPVSVAALAGVWAVNFFVVLPVLNPHFVELVPLPVSLASKLLFGAAMGWIYNRSSSTGGEVARD